MIDAILTEAFMKETSEQRLGFCKVKNDWDGTDTQDMQTFASLLLILILLFLEKMSLNLERMELTRQVIIL